MTDGLNHGTQRWLTQAWYRCPAAVPDMIGLVPPLRDKAALWHEACGRIRRAAALLPWSRAAPQASDYAQRLREFVSVLESGGLTLPEAPPRLDSPPFNGRVVMALYGSEPWMASGYGVRTRCVLHALEEAGVACAAVTRPNFPGDLPSSGHGAVPELEIVDGLAYRRLASPASHHFGSTRRYIEAFAERLADIARETGASVIHAVSNHVVGLAGILAAERLGLPSIYEVRGLWHWSTISRRPGWDRSELFQVHEVLERQTALRADHVVAISEALAGHIAAWGVPEERISVVPNGVDDGLFAEGRRDEALRRGLGGAEGKLMVGFIGTFTPYEGLDLLIRAVTEIRAAGTDIGLILVGDGEEEAGLRRLARRIDAPVVFAGRVPFERVGDYYRAFDCCAFPRHAVGATALTPPLKLAEAMASEVPVVVSDLPALREIVTDGEDGLVCACGLDALVGCLMRLARDGALRRRLAEAGRRKMWRHRRWRHMAERYVDIYRGRSLPESRWTGT